MPDYGVSIEKSTLFRGFQQPFANVYYYRTPGSVNDPLTTLNALLDRVIEKEQNLHATVVQFKRAQLWSTNRGTQELNQMLIQRALSGTGAQINDGRMDRERAVLVQWPAGLDTRGKPVKLRKWYHICGSTPHSIVAEGVLGNIAELTSAQRSSITAEANQLRTVEVLAVQFQLIAKSGRTTTGDATCHRYLEHHQLGDQWR
jgi:hypothetical protein